MFSITIKFATYIRLIAYSSVQPENKAVLFHKFQRYYLLILDHDVIYVRLLRELSTHEKSLIRRILALDKFTTKMKPLLQ
jgi:hypothetical protein